MITIALTSIPPRFAALGPRLAALLAQRPLRICLTIPHRYQRFPDWDGRLPDVPAGVEVLRAEDRGPASKFLTAFEKYPNADILIADDDCDYHVGWLDTFRAARVAHPHAALAASTFDSAQLGVSCGHRIVQGFGGVMLTPAWLPASVLYPDDAAIWVDDIWLSAQLAAAGTDIIALPHARALLNPGPAPCALQDSLIAGKTRAALNRRVARMLQTDLEIWQPPAPD